MAKRQPVAKAKPRDKFPKTDPKAPVSVGGTMVLGGRPSSDERAPDMSDPKRRLQKFKEITYNVSIVGAALTAFRRLISGVKWEAQPPKNLMGGSESDAKLYADLTIEMLHDMGQPWAEVTADASLYPFLGSAVATWQGKRREDDLFGIENIWSVPLETVNRWVTDEVGQLTGIEQKSPVDGNKSHMIPRNRMIYHRHKVIADTPEGTGLLRLIVKDATKLIAYGDLQDIGFENNLDGVPVSGAPLAELNSMVGVARKPPGKGTFTKEDRDEALAGSIAWSKNHVRKKESSLIRDTAVYVDKIGNPTGISKWTTDVLRGTGDLTSIGAAMLDLIKSIARALGVEHMLLGSDGTGSLALGREKYLMFKLLVDATLEYMAWVFRADVLKNMIWPFNGWDPRLIPTLQPQAVQLRDVKAQLDVLEGLNRAATKKSDPAMDIIRDGVDLPPAPEEEPLDLLGGDPNADPNEDPIADPNDPNADPAAGEVDDGGTTPAAGEKPPPANEGAPPRQKRAAA